MAFSPRRPLSLRGREDPEFDGPHEGVPAWLVEPLADWMDDCLHRTNAGGGRSFSLDRARALQITLRLRDPLDLNTATAAQFSINRRMRTDPEFALNAVNHMLIGCSSAQASLLEAYLRAGGSAWEISWDREAERGELTRRALGPVRDAIEEVRPVSDRAHHHLLDAWRKLAGRDPDPTGAYREAVRAVEAVAKPVVLPNDSSATLGKMRVHIRDTLRDWTFTLGGADVIYGLVDALWVEQLDRHGTDEPQAPLNVSPEQADAAVYTAIALVRYFGGGHFHRT